MGTDRAPDAPGHDLVVIGLGPKAAAVCAKAAAVRELGLGAPRVLVVERYGAAAHWGGEHGFTTGTEPLGTRPEKDVGFPYRSADAFGPRGAELDRAMTRYSWQNFLAETGRLGAWVDRGCPAPEHRVFGAYLEWVVRSCGDHVEIRRARVTALDTADGAWLVRTADDDTARATGGNAVVRARAVMVTGPGTPRALGPGPFAHPRLIDAGVHRPALRRMLRERPCARVAVVGGGESAASLALYVHDLVPTARLELFAPGGLRVRDESDEVNRAYTAGAAAEWSLLDEGDRRTFIARTDRGVVSPALSRRLAAVIGDRVHRTAVRSVAPAPGEEDALDLLDGNGTPLGRFDLVLNATGFDPWRQIDELLTPAARTLLTGTGTGTPGGTLDLAAAQRRIGPSLSFDGVRPALYAPALAGLAQGPGFANLSCLGHLSDLVVRDLLDPAATAPRPAPDPLPAATGRTPARNRVPATPLRTPRKEVLHAQA
ncbi:SidA/IucD/PvdA family monooxygenase [Streptomyces sp. NPDC035033]|uniref:SidA/IucD/PvdA family monooxygenase n=1 Tax=Streptomyces sp. NPDC035033 TaxID=3155368 RepID=UPI0033D5C4A0